MSSQHFIMLFSSGKQGYWAVNCRDTLSTFTQYWHVTHAKTDKWTDIFDSIDCNMHMHASCCKYSGKIQEGAHNEIQCSILERSCDKQEIFHVFYVLPLA